MYLLVRVNHPKIILELKNQEGLVDQLVWQDGNDTSVIIFKKIDQLLKKNNLSIKEVSAMKALCDKKSFTAARIVRTVAKTINYCLKND